MKTKVFILLTGAFIATAYLAGCGGGGNNNGTVAATSICQTVPQIANNPTAYQQCVANPQLYAGCTTTTSYGTGTQGYGYGTAGYAYGQPNYGYAGTTGTYPQQGYNNTCPIAGVGVSGVAGVTGVPYGYGQTGYYGQTTYYAQPAYYPPGYVPLQQPIYYNPNRSSLSWSLGYNSGW